MNRAQCYYDLENYPKSIEDLNTALSLEETNP